MWNSPNSRWLRVQATLLVLAIIAVIVGAFVLLLWIGGAM